MQFLVTAYDGTDEGALDRRLAARDKHMELVNIMHKEGKFLYAAAILNESEKMIGSTLIVDFPARADLDEWLEKEPYVMAEVWKRVEVKACKVPPLFLK